MIDRGPLLIAGLILFLGPHYAHAGACLAQTPDLADRVTGVERTPMLAGVAAWAIGHFLATGFLHDVVLFGSFLVWAIADFTVSRRRDRIAGTVYPLGTPAGDAITVAAGVAGWAIFVFLLHQRLIGVNPFA